MVAVVTAMVSVMTMVEAVMAAAEVEADGRGIGVKRAVVVRRPVAPIGRYVPSPVPIRMVVTVVSVPRTHLVHQVGLHCGLRTGTRQSLRRRRESEDSQQQRCGGETSELRHDRRLLCSDPPVASGYPGSAPPATGSPDQPDEPIARRSRRRKDASPLHKR